MGQARLALRAAGGWVRGGVVSWVAGDGDSNLSGIRS